ncbi:MAG TPA: acyloxyacyl hydrolase [Tepidisphaeraceae bacterium]|nr:acyloxyacyl hydrolase [Tepidisphaeraceae bacterium]
MRWTAIILLCGSLFLTRAARADDQSAPVTDFRAGTFDVAFDAVYGHSFIGSQSQLESATVGVGYYFVDNISLSAEFSGFSVQQPVRDSIITSGDLLLRNHLYNRGPFSLFIDFGGGLTYATQRVPASGTNFNFELETGVGFTYRLRDNTYLLAGARYLHFSNADMEGQARNPSVNAFEGYVGVMFTF